MGVYAVKLCRFEPYTFECHVFRYLEIVWDIFFSGA